MKWQGPFIRNAATVARRWRTTYVQRFCSKRDVLPQGDVGASTGPVGVEAGKRRMAAPVAPGPAPRGTRWAGS